MTCSIFFLCSVSFVILRANSKTRYISKLYVIQASRGANQTLLSRMMVALMWSNYTLRASISTIKSTQLPCPDCVNMVRHFMIKNYAQLIVPLLSHIITGNLSHRTQYTLFELRLQYWMCGRNCKLQTTHHMHLTLPCQWLGFNVLLLICWQRITCKSPPILQTSQKSHVFGRAERISLVCLLRTIQLREHVSSRRYNYCLPFDKFHSDKLQWSTSWYNSQSACYSRWIFVVWWSLWVICDISQCVDRVVIAGK